MVTLLQTKIDVDFNRTMIFLIIFQMENPLGFQKGVPHLCEFTICSIKYRH